MNNTNVGIDIIDIETLRDKISSSDLFLRRILSEPEIGKSKIESIAGRIAAKEAVLKTGFILPGEWKKIIISADETGSPVVLDLNGSRISQLKITISHTSKVAVAVALYEKN